MIKWRGDHDFFDDGCAVNAVKWRGDHDFFDDGCAVNAVKWRGDHDFFDDGCAVNKKLLAGTWASDTVAHSIIRNKRSELAIIINVSV